LDLGPLPRGLTLGLESETECTGHCFEKRVEEIGVIVVRRPRGHDLHVPSIVCQAYRRALGQRVEKRLLKAPGHIHDQESRLGSRWSALARGWLRGDRTHQDAPATESV